MVGVAVTLCTVAEAERSLRLCFGRVLGGDHVAEGRPRSAADGQQLYRAVRRREAAAVAGRYIGDRPGLQLVRLAVNCQRCLARDHVVDLLLAVAGMVVVGVALVPLRKLLEVDAEGRDPERPSHRLEHSASAGLDLVDVKHAGFAHLVLLGSSLRSPAGYTDAGWRARCRSAYHMFVSRRYFQVGRHVRRFGTGILLCALAAAVATACDGAANGAQGPSTPATTQVAEHRAAEDHAPRRRHAWPAGAWHQRHALSGTITSVIATGGGDEVAGHLIHHATVWRSRVRCAPTPATWCAPPPAMPTAGR